MSSRSYGKRKRGSGGPRATGLLAASAIAVGLFAGAGFAALSHVSIEDGFVVVEARIARDALYPVQHGGGRIGKVYTAVGNSVAAGELLATVEANDVDRRIEALKAEATAAQLRLEAVKREAKAFDILREQRLIQRSRVDDLEKQVLDLERQAAGMLSSVDEADDRLSLIEIRAPVAGVVHSMRGLVVGHEVRPGETLAEISRMAGAMILECPISARDARAARTGTPVRIWAGRDWKGSAATTGKLISVQPLYGAQAGAMKATHIARVETVRTGELAGELERAGAKPIVAIGLGSRSALKQLLQPLRRFADWPMMHGIRLGVSNNG